MEETLIELKNIYKIYEMGDEEVRANDGISLTINRGEFVAIVGKSGSGKSTLMNIIGALDVPSSGEYLLGGKDVGSMTDNQLADIRNRMIGFIFQQYNLLPKLNLLENVELPLLYAGAGNTARRMRAMASLERVGLAEKWRNLPNQLSGGQQQRVLIARALCATTELLILDEPTVGLDPKQILEIRALIRELAQEHTVILSSHILSEVQTICDQILIIAKGKLVAFDEPGNLERRLLAPSEITLTAEATEQEVRDILSGVGRITGLDLEREAAGNVMARLKTEHDDIYEVSRAVFFAFAEQKKALLEMTLKKANLEDIFLELTDNARQGAPASDAGTDAGCGESEEAEQ